MMAVVEDPLSMKRFRQLAVATTVATLLLIAWGGVVRATGSGDGCPDWPRCFGSWIPKWQYHTLIEYLHRLLGFVSGMLSLALAVVAIAALARARVGRSLDIPRVAAWLAVALAPLFVVQGILGGAVVHSGLDPSVVTLHFAVAFVVLGIAVAITTIAYLDRPGIAPHGGGYARLAAWTATATFALLLVGTYVRAVGAGLAFRDWPLMGGRLFPSLTVAGAVDMFFHRGLAVVATALVGWTAVRARTMQPRSRLLVRLSTLVVVFVVGQVILGGLNVLSELATLPRALHVVMSALIWAGVAALAVAARREPSGEPAERAIGDAPAAAEGAEAEAAGT